MRCQLSKKWSAVAFASSVILQETRRQYPVNRSETVISTSNPSHRGRGQMKSTATSEKACVGTGKVWCSPASEVIF
jgi:hypothetical protein